MLGDAWTTGALRAIRARLMVTQRIKAAIRKIRAGHPSLGRSLSTSVKTGYFCTYTSDPDRPVAWEF